MKRVLFYSVVLCLATLSVSCVSVKDNMPSVAVAANDNEDITESLFNDKDASISEENIQAILNGKYTLPGKLRIAVVNLENKQYKRSYWNNEDYLSSRQQYLDAIVTHLEKQAKVESVSLIPSIMLSASPSFTSIREAAVRMQADIVLVYSVSGGTYSKYRMFSGNKYKAFATTQVLVMDTRTGLVPFTDVVSKDAFYQKGDADFNEDDAEKRTQEKAVLETLSVISDKLNIFFNK